MAANVHPNIILPRVLESRAAGESINDIAARLCSDGYTCSSTTIENMLLHQFYSEIDDFERDLYARSDRTEYEYLGRCAVCHQEPPGDDGRMFLYGGRCNLCTVWASGASTASASTERAPAPAPPRVRGLDLRLGEEPGDLALKAEVEAEAMAAAEAEAEARMVAAVAAAEARIVAAAEAIEAAEGETWSEYEPVDESEASGSGSEASERSVADPL